MTALAIVLLTTLCACGRTSEPVADTARHRALLHELCALMEPGDRAHCPSQYRDEPDQYIQQAIDGIHQAVRTPTP